MNKISIKLGDVARECRQTWGDNQNGVPIVGLEHLVPGEIELKSWDCDIEHTFSKKFTKGQVLLGRRRVYLRKASVAPCDGICSGDITVIESSGGILPELLPFVIQNDRFFDYAMQGSAGSLSPRVKWEHLKNYEFSLPPLDEQKILADKLWAAYRLKESYKKLLATTEEMVKSQFIEMFGENSKIPYTKTTVESLCTSIVRGPFGSAITISSFVAKSDSTIKVYEQKNAIQKSATLGNYYITKEHYEKLKRFECHPHDIIMSCAGTIGELYQLPEGCEKGIINQALCKFTLNDKVMDDFFIFYLKMNIQNLEKKGSGMKNVGSVTFIKSLPINLPSIEDQNAFVLIKQQADKSGFELRKSIDAIDAVIKSLINN